jgi:hypothetical protein
MNGVPARPDQEFRVGAVRVAVWINPRQTSDGKSFNSHKVVLERTYKDSRGDFQTTQALELNDIPKAILALKKTYEFCLMRRPEERSAAGQANMEYPREFAAPPRRIP